MSYLDRFSVSLDTELLAAFDRHIANRGYENRSEAIRDLIRDMLVTHRAARGDEPASAMLTLVLGYRSAETAKRFRSLLREHEGCVLGSWRVGLDEHRDHLVVALKGSKQQVQAIADQVLAMRGVSHGQLSLIPLDGGPADRETASP